MNRPAAELVKKIIETEAERISKRYRIEKERARRILKSKLEACSFLLKSIEQAETYQELRKKAKYKEFIKKIRKEIYYNLRRYHLDEEKEKNVIRQLGQLAKTAKSIKERDWKNIRKELVSLHVSTLERESYLEEFNSEILNIIKNDKYILDLGSGFYPLTFPFEKAKSLKRYICLEKDERAVRVLRIFKKLVDNRLDVFGHKLGERDWSYYLPKNTKTFDTALMLKLIPVISRQQRKILRFLAAVPAEKIIITANKEAMTRRQKILKREDRTLKEFVELARKKIEQRLDFENEFGYLIS